ncbi:MAG: division/cell wall cluster transcriptional repressor MraZ [Caldimicrobium sp.]|nr:division/cell wall cluster transcriptional repressor MraZ [Caldimicrobium sp.]MCX7612968.1 division/cell wall cluster transcriptional repressor MraZ [Caldimicrobium sp.]MDW8183206.1 division/cell wall cluster transcriptional repressor MraZ [Caldimicrobium sp.]
MFRGRFRHSIDEKGRISLPSKFREVLRVRYGTESLVVTNIPECLVVYPVVEWKKMEEALLKIPFTIKEGREFLRYFLGSAEEVEPDKQGRLLLPQSLRSEIKLDREVILLGMLTYFEIWNPQVLEERFKGIKDSFEAILGVIHPYLAEENRSGSS